MVLATWGVAALLLRRLKGESLPDEEPSTHGVEVWAGQAEAHLKGDANATGEWKEWKESESMHRTAIKDSFACGICMNLFMHPCYHKGQQTKAEIDFSTFFPHADNYVPSNGVILGQESQAETSADNFLMFLSSFGLGHL